MAEIVEARHVTGPQKVPPIAGAENVDEEIETRKHLKDVVDGEEGSQLERRAIFHQSANKTPLSSIQSQSLSHLTSAPIGVSANKRMQSSPMARQMTSMAACADRKFHPADENLSCQQTDQTKARAPSCSN